MLRNHDITFRPLRGGISCFNPLANPASPEQGTIGLIATADGQDRWLVSCYHVLCRSDGSAFGHDEPVYQPSGMNPAHSVARTVAGMGHFGVNVDCAAVRVTLPADQCTGEILGLGILAPPIDPAPGMRVMKSGAATGITEGVIRQVDQDLVTIEPLPGFGDQGERYELSKSGDSGAVWVERATVAPVALHFAGNGPGEPERARAMRINRVLALLDLQAVIGF